MQIPKWIVGLVIALAVLLALGGMALSPKFKVSRSVTINAPAAKVYALMADPRRWQEWSAWNQRDPGMAITYWYANPEISKHGETDGFASMARRKAQRYP